MKQSLLVLAVAALSSLSVMTGAVANDFPTQARVEFVLSCMDTRGGQSYNSLYPCVCAVDRIAERMPYREYTAAETLSFLYSTPGERGGFFRDAAPRSRKRIKAFLAVREEAEAACFVPGVASVEAQ
jgi:hypothetical protein